MYFEYLEDDAAAACRSSICEKWIVDFIWNIADDSLRDVYVCGKYRDVIRSFTVLRRLDAELESTKDAGLESKKFLDQHGLVDQEGALRMGGGLTFYL